MALPTIALADHLATVLPDDWSVMQGPISQPGATSTWCSEQMVSGSLLSPSVTICSATLPSRRLCLHSCRMEKQTCTTSCIRLMDNLPEMAGMFCQSHAPVLDQSTGTALLAAKMILTTQTSEQEAS